MKRKFKVISLEEFDLHNTPGDTWLIVNGTIIDVSTVMKTHPGGSEVMVANAGRDATPHFLAQAHSAGAVRCLEDLTVGMLSDKDLETVRARPVDFTPVPMTAAKGGGGQTSVLTFDSSTTPPPGGDKRRKSLSPPKNNTSSKHNNDDAAPPSSMMGFFQSKHRLSGSSPLPAPAPAEQPQQEHHHHHPNHLPQHQHHRQLTINIGPSFVVGSNQQQQQQTATTTGSGDGASTIAVAKNSDDATTTAQQQQQQQQESPTLLHPSTPFGQATVGPPSPMITTAPPSPQTVTTPNVPQRRDFPAGGGSTSTESLPRANSLTGEQQQQQQQQQRLSSSGTNSSNSPTTKQQNGHQNASTAQYATPEIKPSSSPLPPCSPLLDDYPVNKNQEQEQDRRDEGGKNKEHSSSASSSSSSPVAQQQQRQQQLVRYNLRRRPARPPTHADKVALLEMFCTEVILRREADGRNDIIAEYLDMCLSNNSDKPRLPKSPIPTISGSSSSGKKGTNTPPPPSQAEMVALREMFMVESMCRREAEARHQILLQCIAKDDLVGLFDMTSTSSSPVPPPPAEAAAVEESPLVNENADGDDEQHQKQQSQPLAEQQKKEEAHGEDKNEKFADQQQTTTVEPQEANQQQEVSTSNVLDKQPEADKDPAEQQQQQQQQQSDDETATEQQSNNKQVMMEDDDTSSAVQQQQQQQQQPPTPATGESPSAGGEEGPTASSNSVDNAAAVVEFQLEVDTPESGPTYCAEQDFAEDFYLRNRKPSTRTSVDHLKFIVKLADEIAVGSQKAMQRATVRHLRAAARHWYIGVWAPPGADERGVSDFESDEDDTEFITMFRNAKKMSIEEVLSILLKKEFNCRQRQKETLLSHVAAEHNVPAIAAILRYVKEKSLVPVTSRADGAGAGAGADAGAGAGAGDGGADDTAAAADDTAADALGRQLCAQTLSRSLLLQRDEDAVCLLLASPAKWGLGSAQIDSIHGDSLLHALCRRRRPRAQLIEKYLRYMVLNGESDFFPAGGSADGAGAGGGNSTGGNINEAARSSSGGNGNGKKKQQQQQQRPSTSSPNRARVVVAKETPTGTGDQSRREAAATPQPTSKQTRGGDGDDKEKKKAATAPRSSPSANSFDINAKNANGHTPLHLVVTHSIGVEGRSTFNLLVEFGASIYIRGPNGDHMADMCNNPFIRDILEAKLGGAGSSSMTMMGGGTYQSPASKQQQHHQSSSSSSSSAAAAAGTANNNQQQQQHHDVDPRVRRLIDAYDDVLALPHTLLSPGGIHRKNERIELDDKRNNNDDDDDDDDDNGSGSGGGAGGEAVDNKNKDIDVGATVDRLYVNPKKQRKEFVDHWLRQADKKRDARIQAIFPRGRAPPKHVSGSRVSQLVQHLHDESCRQKTESMERLREAVYAAEEEGQIKHGRLSRDEMRDMGDRLCNSSMSRKAASLERIEAAMYPKSDARPLSPARVTALGQRLHDECRAHAGAEIQKLFEKYVPPTKVKTLTEDERYANAERLSKSPERYRSPKKEG